MFAVKNWSEALDPSFGIPTDVVFACIDDENGDISNIAAHKCFLAMVSPVFKAMFFGPAKETREVVPIGETNRGAFALMIDYIYEKEVSWEDKKLTLLLEVVNLAEMYNVEGLIEEVKKTLTKFPLTPETVIDVASAAEMFSHFEEISNQLLSHCAIFLSKQVLINKEETQQYVTRYIDSPYYYIAFKLLEMAKDLPPVKCENCLQVECDDRLPLSMQNMREGCRVFFRPGSSTVEVVGYLVEECKEESGQVWWVREEDEGFVEGLVRVKLINLFFACKS